MKPLIAIDGPSASGKSTVAKLLAKKLNFLYVDTGAMYRAFTWKALQEKVNLTSRPEVKNLIQRVKFEILLQDGATALFIDGGATTPHIRTEEVNANVSKISAIPELREYLTNRMRQLRQEDRLVMEGRDIGTVVAPDTIYKFYIDADESIRDSRRKAQGEKDSLHQRDLFDKNRTAAPLLRAADALLIDSGKLSAEAIVDQIYERVNAMGILK